MSDNVANVDLDDVLTSIRKLVADRDGGAPLPDDGKLVLSEALRVVAEDDALSQTPVTDKPKSGPTTAGNLAATIALLEDAVSGSGSFDLDVEAETDNFPNAGPAFFRSAKAAEDRAEAAKRIEETPPEATLAFVPQDTGTPADPAPLKLSEAEAVVAAPKSDATANSLQAPVSIDDEVPDEDEDVILDEDTLRDMVRAIVREELQGNLGEAITRNIRKLIRKEIHAYFDVTDRP